MSEKVRTRLEELDDLEEVGCLELADFLLLCGTLRPPCVCGFMFSGLSEGAAEPLPAGLRQPHRGAEPVPEGGLGLRPEGQSPEDRHPGKAAATQTQFPLWFRTSALRVCPPLQCSKLLSDTAVIQFYPSKFVLITDILDTFGGRDRKLLLPFTSC